MDVIKKNLVAIVCGLAALIALAIPFFPVGGWVEELQAKLDNADAMSRQSRQLASKQHLLPVFEPNKTEPDSLSLFPTRNIIEAGQELVRTMESESSKMVEKAMSANRQTTLDGGQVFPRMVGGVGAAHRFKQNYYRAMRNMVAALNAAPPPTGTQEQEMAEQIWRKEWRPRAVGPEDEQALLTEFETVVVPELPNRLRLETAQRCTMYIGEGERGSGGMVGRFVPGSGGFGRQPGMTTGTPVPGNGALDMHPSMPEEHLPAPPDMLTMWMAQHAIWIQQDIVTAIHATNLGEGRTLPTVQDAPIKRLVRVEVPKQYMLSSGPLVLETTAGGNVGQPAAVAAVPGADPMMGGGASQSYSVSPTGRVSNPLYDVMHFTFAVDIDARYVERFMSLLTAGKFITILRVVDMSGVDREDMLQSGMMYGKHPVVQLTLECEALFFRAWTEKIMPEQVKKLLGMIPPEMPAF